MRAAGTEGRRAPQGGLVGNQALAELLNTPVTSRSGGRRSTLGGHPTNLHCQDRNQGTGAKIVLLMHGNARAWPHPFSVALPCSRHHPLPDPLPGLPGELSSRPHPLPPLSHTPLPVIPLEGDCARESTVEGETPSLSS